MSSNPEPDETPRGNQLQEFIDQSHPFAEEEKNRTQQGCPVRVPVPGETAKLPLFPALVVPRRTGSEPFHRIGAPVGFDLLSFWQWVASDLANNTLRGLLAEYLVAQSLGIAQGVRVEWDRYDLRSTSGTAIEVKAAAYLQSWAQRKLSNITFDIAPTRGWDAETNTWDETSKRQGELYVFALLHHRDKATLDPLNVEQWMFFVLATKMLNTAVTTQQSISLSRLLSLKPIETTFGSLRDTIERVAAQG